MQYMLGGVSWDYDRDGIAEIVVETMLGDVQRGARRGRSAEEIFMSTDLPVYDLNGREAARLQAVAAMSGSMLVADIDGDGWEELLAEKPGADASYKSSTLLAFGDHGKQIAKLQTNSIMFSTTGDVDGDGRDELVTLTNRLNDLVAEGQDQQPETLYKSQHSIHPLACADLNGDGYAEVVLARSRGFELSYLDCLSKKTTNLFVPVLRDDPWTAVPPYATAGRFIAGKDAVIAVAASMDSGILLFDATGKCIHYEEFGDMVWGVRTVHAGGQDYLVVQLSERLLIYPDSRCTGLRLAKCVWQLGIASHVVQYVRYWHVAGRFIPFFSRTPLTQWCVAA